MSSRESWARQDRPQLAPLASDIDLGRATFSSHSRPRHRWRRIHKLPHNRSSTGLRKNHSDALRLQRRFRNTCRQSLRSESFDMPRSCARHRHCIMQRLASESSQGLELCMPRSCGLWASFVSSDRRMVLLMAAEQPRARALQPPSFAFSLTSGTRLPKNDPVYPVESVLQALRATGAIRRKD